MGPVDAALNATMRRLVYIIGVNSSLAALRRGQRRATSHSRSPRGMATRTPSHNSHKPNLRVLERTARNHHSTVSGPASKESDLGGARDAFGAVSMMPTTPELAAFGGVITQRVPDPGGDGGLRERQRCGHQDGGRCDGAGRVGQAREGQGPAVADWAGFDYAVEAVARDASSTEGLAGRARRGELSPEVAAREAPAPRFQYWAVFPHLSVRKRGKLRVGFVTSDFGAHPSRPL